MQIRRYVWSWLCSCMTIAFLICGCGKNEVKQETVSQLQDLNSPRYAIGGMTGIVATEEARKAFPKAKILEYSMPIDGFTALAAGKLDAMVLDRPTLEFMAIAHPELTVMPQDLAVGSISVAVAKNNGKLLREINGFIRKYRADGTYAEMCRRWFHTKDSGMPEIPSATKVSGTLKVGITANNEPLCFLKDTEFAGFDSEFSLRLGAFLGKKVEFIDMPYDALVMALESGRIDVAVAYMDAMPEREESVSFSENYIDSPISVIVHKKNYSSSCYSSLAELKGKRIGTLTGTAYEDLVKGHLPEYKVFSFSQLNQAVAALENHKIDALITDRPIARFVRNQRPKLAEIPQYIPCGDTAFMFPQRERDFCEAFSRELRAMKQNGTLKKLQSKWFDGQEEKKDLPAVTGTGDKVTLCTVPESQPFSYVADGKITGYEIEIAILIANKLNRKLELKHSDYASFIEDVQSGKADFAGSCITITKERQEKMLFSEPDYDGGIALLTLKKNVPEISGGIGQWFKDGIRSLGESFEKTFIREMRWKLILQGLATTLFITVFAVLLGTILAFPVCMMSRSSRKLPAFLADRYVSIIMGTPILVILMILYYVIFAKVDISGVLVAIFAFALDFAAYTSVTLRSGIDGVPRGQMEAALALGHTPFAAFMRFVLPQAVRTILPVYRGEIISTLKATSIVGYIAIMDLTKMGDIIRSRTYEAFFPLIAIALIYFLTAKALTAVLLILEHRLDPNARRARMLKRGVK